MFCTFSSPSGNIPILYIHPYLYSQGTEKMHYKSGCVCAARHTPFLLRGEMGFRVEVQVAIYPIYRNERGRARAVLVSCAAQPIGLTGSFGNQAAGVIVRRHRVWQRFALSAARKDHSLPDPHLRSTWALSGLPIASQGHIRGSFAQSFRRSGWRKQTHAVKPRPATCCWSSEDNN